MRTVWRGLTVEESRIGPTFWWEHAMSSHELPPNALYGAWSSHRRDDIVFANYLPQL